MAHFHSIHVSNPVPGDAGRQQKWKPVFDLTGWLSSAGCIYHRGRTLFHAGMAREGHVLGTATIGDVAQTAMDTGKGNYLANLLLYPGNIMFETCLV